jgi:tetratricopeptide (TPR) repeat protein
MIEAHHRLMEVYAARQDATGVTDAARRTLEQFPSDADARDWLARASSGNLSTKLPEGTTPESFVDRSLALYHAGRYEEAIAASQEALKLKPGYALAWSNISASYNAMTRWDDGIRAANEALRLQPGLEVARGNLAWAENGKSRQAAIR